MTTSDLARILIEKNGLDKESAQRFLTAVFDTVMYGLQKDKTVKVKGLGTFKVIEVDARESVNVNTGERHLIDSHSKITFTPDTAMKELVNKPFSSFDTVILNEGVSFDDMESTEPSQEQSPQSKDPAPVVEPAEEESAPVTEATEEEPAPVVDAVEATPVADAVEEEPSPVVEPAEEEPSPVADAVEEELAPVAEAVEEEPASVAEAVEEEPAPVAEAVEEEPAPVEEAIEEEPAPVAETVEEEPSAPDEESKPEPTPLITEPADKEGETDDYGMNPKRKEHKWIWPLALVLCSVASFFLGYHTAYRLDPIPYFQNFDTLLIDSIDSISANDSTTRLNVTEARRADSLKQVSQKQEAQKQEAQKQEAQRKDSQKQEAQKQEAQRSAPQSQEKQKRGDAEEVDYRKYEQMDARVRTGAYRIVGTAQVLKCGPGETLGRISKRYLGPEMVCYLEVYNGMKASEPLEPGTTVKIPKLELKKKKKTN